MPGADPDEAARVVLGELADLPHLAELPARGPGADMIGRTAALLVDLPVDLQPSGWRLVPRGGRDLQRARELLARDLDALAVAALGYTGPLKVQVSGPWTLAAQLQAPVGGAALRDPGAVRDLRDSLSAGIGEHLAAVRRAVPGATPVVQLDEPSLARVLAGRVATPSGFGAVAAVPESDAVGGLAAVLASLPGAAVVHCCADRPPLGALARAGAGGLSVDLATLSPRDDDALGGAVEAGRRLLLGVVPAVDAPLPPIADLARTVRRLWRRLGFPPERLAATVTLTPACGLAGASPAYAREVLGLLVRAGRLLADEPEGD